MAERAVTLDTTQLARLLDITPRRVNQLAGDGILTRARDEVGKELSGRWEMVPNVHAYIKHLRGQARLDDESNATFVSLRNSRLASEAEMADLRLRELKGELLRRDDVDFWISNTLTAFKARIQAIAARISGRLRGKTKFKEIYATIKTETDLALEELSNLNSREFDRQRKAFLLEQGVDEEKLNGQNEDTSDKDERAGGFSD